MTTDTIHPGSCPTVFEAGLPTIACDHLTDPDEAHRIIAHARSGNELCRRTRRLGKITRD
jgi:hypothetical protein